MAARAVDAGRKKFRNARRTSMPQMKSSNLGSVYRIIIILIRKTSSFSNIGFSQFRFSFVKLLVIRICPHKFSQKFKRA
jgi:hypothetical protein